jgi:hypothetical protein
MDKDNRYNSGRNNDGLGDGFSMGWSWCWSLGADLFGACYPEAGVDVGEDAVAIFDLSETCLLRGGEGAGEFEALPDSLDLVELIVMGEETDLSVVAGGAGGDQELPVGGLEEKKFAAELLYDAGALRSVAPLACSADLAGVELGGIDVGVGPAGVGVHPDIVCTPGSP